MELTLFKKYLLFSILSNLFLSVRSEDAAQKLNELRKSLLKNYHTEVRPVVQNTNTTVVSMIVYPIYVQDLEENRQILVMDAWLDLEWTDKRFTWDENVYGDVTIDFKEDEIWKPDVKVISSSPMSEINPYGNIPINVQNDGIVRWMPPATLRSRCSMNYDNYPYDQQNCAVNFSSWSSLGEEIDLYTQMNSADTSYFDNSNPNWNYVDSKCIRDIFKDPCCPEFWVLISCNFVFSRRNPYGREVEWCFSLVVVLLTLTMFWMPPDKGKKLILGCTSLFILFSELLFFTLTSPSRRVAIYTAYLIEQSVFAVLSAIIMEVIVLNLTRITVFEPPHFILDVFSQTVKKILCLCPPDEDKSSVQKDWYTVALCTDRFLFLLFSIVFVSLKKWV